MPDVQEVFRMATQKVRPDPGALERQNRSQRRRSTRQRAGAYALLAVLVIAAVVIGVLALRTRDRRPAGQRETEPSAAELATQPFFLDLETGEKTLLPEKLAGGYSYSASPDGTRLAYAPSTGGGCEEGGITIANIDGSDVLRVQPPPGFINCAPRWSPDGTKLVYQQRPETDGAVGNLFVFDLNNGGNPQVTDLELKRAWWWFLFPSFSSESDRIIYHMPRSSSRTTEWDVWSVRIPSTTWRHPTTGTPTLLVPNASFPMANPFPPCDSFAIHFLLPWDSDLGGRSIMTGHPNCSSWRTLVEAQNSIWWPTVSPDGDSIAYQDGGSIYVLDILTGESSTVTDGNTADWLDNDTLIVTPRDLGAV